MNEQILHQKIIVAPYKGKTTITCKLHRLGNQSPYFSFTTDNGCDHERIAKAAPDVAKFLPLHLSDSEGIPMHFAANGLYFYEQKEVGRLRSMLNCSEDEVKKLVSELTKYEWFTLPKQLEEYEAENPKAPVEPEARRIMTNRFIIEAKPYLDRLMGLAQECIEWMKTGDENRLLQPDEVEEDDDDSAPLMVILPDNEVIEVDGCWYSCYLPQTDGPDYYIARNREEAGEAAAERWRDLVDSDPEEVIAVIGSEVLLDWALGRPNGPGNETARSLTEWIETVVYNHPEEEFGHYDGMEYDILVNESLADGLGIEFQPDSVGGKWMSVVGYRYN